MIANLLKTSIAAAAALTFFSAAASAVTVVNGSFEADAGEAIDGQLFSTLAGSPEGNGSWSVFKTLPGWTNAGGPGIEIQTEETVGLIPQDQNHYVELDSDHARDTNSAMQQTLDFTSTGRYLLSFFFSPRVDGKPGVKTNIIDYSLFGAVSLVNVFAESVSGPSDGPPKTAVGFWTKITAEFTITEAGKYTLKFAASGKDDSLGGFVDNVSISAVPVPAAGFLLIGALGGLAALRRRKTA